MNVRIWYSKDFSPWYGTSRNIRTDNCNVNRVSSINQLQLTYLLMLIKLLKEETPITDPLLKTLIPVPEISLYLDSDVNQKVNERSLIYSMNCKHFTSGFSFFRWNMTYSTLINGVISFIPSL